MKPAFTISRMIIRYLPLLIRELIPILEKNSEICIKWFIDNGMSANPEKFHGFIVNRCGRHNDVHKLNFAGFEITSEKIASSRHRYRL